MTCPPFGRCGETPALPASIIKHSLSVETNVPVFANFSPTGGDAIGSNSRPRVQAEFTDGDSGLKETGLGIVFAIKRAGLPEPCSPTTTRRTTTTPTS